MSVKGGSTVIPALSSSATAQCYCTMELIDTIEKKHHMIIGYLLRLQKHTSAFTENPSKVCNVEISVFVELPVYFR